MKKNLFNFLCMSVLFVFTFCFQLNSQFLTFEDNKFIYAINNSSNNPGFVYFDTAIDNVLYHCYRLTDTFMEQKVSMFHSTQLDLNKE